MCFASDSRHLYVSSLDTLYQFDVEAPDIAASQTTVAVYDGFLDPFQLNFYQMERGPDCKIYINSTSGSSSLHVILYPDRPGTACEVRQHHLITPWPRERNMLNAPNYRMGTGYPTCDSTLNVVTSSFEAPLPRPATGGMRLAPNPTHGRLGLRFDLPFTGTLEIYDARGVRLRERRVVSEVEAELDLGDLPPGMYFLRAQHRTGEVRTERVVKL